MTPSQNHDADPMGAEATLDAHAEDSSSLAGRGPRVELVRGRRPHLSGQVQSLLHVRLRAAALVLFLGSAAFLFKNFATPPRAYPNAALADDARMVNFLHMALVAILGAASIVLWSRKKLSMRRSAGPR